MRRLFIITMLFLFFSPLVFAQTTMTIYWDDVITGYNDAGVPADRYVTAIWQDDGACESDDGCLGGDYPRIVQKGYPSFSNDAEFASQAGAEFQGEIDAVFRGLFFPNGQLMDTSVRLVLSQTYMMIR